MEYICRYAPLALFTAYAVKLLAFSATFQDAIVMLGMIGIVAFFEYKPEHKELKDLKVELKQLKEDIRVIHTRVEETKSSVVGMKLASGMSPKGTTKLGSF